MFQTIAQEDCFMSKVWMENHKIKKLLDADKKLSYGPGVRKVSKPIFFSVR